MECHYSASKPHMTYLAYLVDYFEHITKPPELISILGYHNRDRPMRATTRATTELRHTQVRGSHSNINVLTRISILSNIYQFFEPKYATTSSISYVHISISCTRAIFQAFLLTFFEVHGHVVPGKDCVRQFNAGIFSKSLSFNAAQ
ncbi:hypothetical protein F8388_011314 [Cannabis sativa]|uniref:Uncharacterized protein n=1 Tax=Cannabis sativa TaxID=3483 RepID=A0A7J6FCW7_CANSA|nr:hypothetical protein F8388_011314 [Cannabis sativa]